MRMLNDVPLSLAEVTPAWMSAALGEEVTAVTPQSVINGTAVKAVLALEYAPRAAAGLPRTVCVKGGMDLPHAEALAKSGSYVAEGRFYRDICPHVALPVPGVLALAIDEAKGHCVILMQDLNAADARFLRATRDVLQPSEAAKLLADLARLHTRWWGGAAELNWLDTGLVPESPLGRYFSGFTPDIVAAQLERRGDGLRAATRSDPKRIHAAYWQLESHSADAPLCVLHGDAHIGNFYRDQNGAPGMCDWQTMMWGRWSHDVAYLIGSSLDPAIRGSAERGLLAGYAEQLRGFGAVAGTIEEMWEEYRRAMLYGFYGWMTNPLYFQPEEISAATAYRFAIAIEELGSIDLLLAN